LSSVLAKWVRRHTFWRTTTQQEIDYVEDAGGQLHAFEFKWKTGKPGRFPKAFLEAYPNSETTLVTPERFEPFVGVD